MKRNIITLVAILTLMGIAFFAGSLITGYRAGQDAEKKEESLIAVSWGDGRYGPAFYGAYVFTVPLDSGFSVRAHVKIGRNRYYHDCEEIGRAQTHEEAVARWSKIEWREDGLHIGSGTNQYFLPRRELENHR